MNHFPRRAWLSVAGGTRKLASSQLGAPYIYYLLVVCCVLAAASPAAALTPDSPEVKEAIAKGIAFLETQTGGGLGVKALVGLTLAKHGTNPEHPQIQNAVKLIQDGLQGGADNFNHDIYSTGVAVMFLVAVNPKKYHYEIDMLARSLHRRQKEGGAWGYPLDSPNGKTCDTSMTQFAILGLWEAADQSSVETPLEVWERAAAWLVRTQDPTGGFGYQGNDSGALGSRVKQSGPLHSMSVAGMCSIYICRDRLGLSRLRSQADDDVPAALRPIETDEERGAQVKTKLDPRLLARARADGNHWISDKFTIEKPSGWLHYYLYALERYETIRQMEGVRAAASPWYDRGARFLLSTQASNGSWESQAKNPPDTCFALLFLMRSMKKSLERYSARYREGILAGGRGVPAAGNVRLRDGQVVIQAEGLSLDELLGDLKSADDSRRQQAIAALADLAEQADQAALDRHGDSLKRLATSPDRELRLAAVRVLASSRSLDYVPELIKRLEDDDVEIALAACDGLRRMSRRFDAFGFELRASDAVRKDAVNRWKEWYRSIRPDVELD